LKVVKHNNYKNNALLNNLLLNNISNIERKIFPLLRHSISDKVKNKSVLIPSKKIIFQKTLKLFLNKKFSKNPLPGSIFTFVKKHSHFLVKNNSKTRNIFLKKYIKKHNINLTDMSFSYATKDTTALVRSLYNKNYIHIKKYII